MDARASLRPISKARVRRCRAGGFVDDPFGQVRLLNFDFAIIHLASSLTTLSSYFSPEERETHLVNIVRKAVQRHTFAPTSCSVDAHDNSTRPIINPSTIDWGSCSER